MGLFNNKKPLSEEDYFLKFQKHLKKVNEEVSESFDNEAVQLGGRVFREVMQIINAELEGNETLYNKIMTADGDTTLNFYEKVLEAILNDITSDIGNNDPRAGAAPDETGPFEQR